MEKIPGEKRVLAQAHRIIILLGCAAVAIPLAGYIITGTFMRYSGDDFCYGGILTQYGFWKAQWVSYWQVMPYHGNRYSLTLLSDISGTIGPLSSAALPGLAIISLVTGLVFVLSQLKSLLRYAFTIWEMILFALLLVFFAIYQAPNLAQSLYWRSGMLPYFAPIIVNTFVVGILLKAVREQHASVGSILLIVVLSFIGGGFSETATALQIGFLVLLLGGFWLWGKKGDAGIKTGIRLGIIALITASVALLLLALSPSIDERLANANHPDVFHFLWISLRSALSFSFQSLLGQPVPTAINFLLFLTLSYLFFSRYAVPERFAGMRYLKYYALIAVASLILILCVTAPSAYAQSAFPELRALFMARFIMVIGISLGGFVTGMLLNHWLQSTQRQAAWIQVGVLVLAGFLLIYPIYAARNIYSDLQDYHRWATFWDARDRAIQEARQAGQMDLEVVEIDHIIPDVGDLYPSPKHWHNVCASAYYGVNTISANQPGWDD